MPVSHPSVGWWGSLPRGSAGWCRAVDGVAFLLRGLHYSCPPPRRCNVCIEGADDDGAGADRSASRRDGARAPAAMDAVRNAPTPRMAVYPRVLKRTRNHHRRGLRGGWAIYKPARSALRDGGSSMSGLTNLPARRQLCGDHGQGSCLISGDCADLDCLPAGGSLPCHRDDDPDTHSDGRVMPSWTGAPA